MPSARALAVLATAGLTLAVLLPPAAAHAAAPGLVRVDQVGYLPGDTKQAYLMVAAPVRAAGFAVVDAAGHRVLAGRVGATSRGAWNGGYRAVYPITFTDLRAT